MCRQMHEKVSEADILNLCCLTACHEGPQSPCLSVFDLVKVLIAEGDSLSRDTNKFQA